MNNKELKEYLDFKASQYENIDFITNDPIKIPHQYQRKEDIEICAFFTATIAWGNRLSIIKSGENLMRIWGGSLTNSLWNMSPMIFILFTELLTQMILIFSVVAYRKYTKMAD